MIDALLRWLSFILCVIFLPLLTTAIVRKTKARLQNRKGPQLLQPIFDLIKLCRKGETLSETMSGVFRIAAVASLAVMLVAAWLTPWISFKPASSNCDLFLVLYLFALARLFCILGALDSGSAFGAFAASREATLALLAEPAALLSFVSLGVLTRTSNLSEIFSIGNIHLLSTPFLWILTGTALLLASLVELSRMPVDDPTTHLELTMVHEAMILEASGRNLALIEFSHALHMTILFGLCSQCYLRAIPAMWTAPVWQQAIGSMAGIFVIAVVVATFESVAVKLQWRKVPEFIAYSMTMSLLACFMAVAGGMLR